LTGDIKNLTELNVTPDLSPARLAVAVQAFAISIRGSLKIVLQKKDFCYPIMRE